MINLLKRLTAKPQWLFLAIVVIAGFCRLGFWQLDRAEQKREISAAVDKQGFIELKQGQALPANWTKIRLAGEYSNQHWLLDNQLNNGKAGFEVLSLFQLMDGRKIIVNRGWVSQLNNVDAAISKTKQSILGVVAPHRAAGMRMGEVIVATRQNGLKVVNYPTAKDFSEWLDAEVLDASIWLDKNQPNGFVRNWQPPEKSAEKHLAYAVQWFALALTVLIVFLILSLRREHNDESV